MFVIIIIIILLLLFFFRVGREYIMGKKKMSNYNVEIGFRNKCCARGAERELYIVFYMEG